MPSRVAMMGQMQMAIARFVTKAAGWGLFRLTATCRCACRDTQFVYTRYRMHIHSLDGTDVGGHV